MKLLSTLLSLLVLAACHAPEARTATPAAGSGLERVLILAKGME